jgi:hypothetical protein
MSDAFRELADLERWVTWRNEFRNGSDKPTKMPYAPGTGQKAKADDPATWGTRTEAAARYKQVVNGNGGGIGIELGDLGYDLHLAGLDLDSCIKDGQVAPWAEAILQVAQTYAETSPSGTGIKAFYYAATEDVRPFLDSIGVPIENWGCRRGIPGEDAKDHGPAIEVYLNGRYFAVTGKQRGAIDQIKLLDRDQLDRIAALIPPTKTPDSSGKTASGDTSRSAIAYRQGIRLQREGKTYDEMVAALLADPETAEWARTKGQASGQREFKRIWDKAEQADCDSAIALDDFYAYMPAHQYIWVPGRAMWPSASVNARLAPIPVLNPDGSKQVDDKGKGKFMPASAWLDKNRSVEQMTWAPGLPTLIEDKIMLDGGWVHKQGVACFNMYLPPQIEDGDPEKAQPWLDHLRYVYPDQADHIILWLAQRVQQPHVKINHAIVLGGKPGIGKDTILEPVKYAVGPWNWAEVTPQQILGRFNPFLKSVILRVSEARDLGDFDRFQFYEHMKTIIAAPPDVMRIDEKHLREYAIPNICGVAITTNRKTNGIYIEPDDRRHLVAWSTCTKEDPKFEPGYWDKLWAYYDNGGRQHVNAYLQQLDISGFNPKAPPPKTEAFFAIVDANRVSEDAELQDILDELGNRKAITLDSICLKAADDFRCWLTDRKNRKQIPHRFEACGYVPVRNKNADDGLWRVNGKRQAIYALAELSLRDQYDEASKL